MSKEQKKVSELIPKDIIDLLSIEQVLNLHFIIEERAMELTNENKK